MKFLILLSFLVNAIALGGVVCQDQNDCPDGHYCILNKCERGYQTPDEYNQDRYGREGQSCYSNLDCGVYYLCNNGAPLTQGICVARENL